MLNTNSSILSRDLPTTQRSFSVTFLMPLPIFFTALGKAIVKFFVGIGKGFANYGKTFVKGDWATKLSYLIFGVGDLSKGKYYKGILFLRC